MDQAAAGMNVAITNLVDDVRDEFNELKQRYRTLLTRAEQLEGAQKATDETVNTLKTELKQVHSKLEREKRSNAYLSQSFADYQKDQHALKQLLSSTLKAQSDTNEATKPQETSNMKIVQTEWPMPEIPDMTDSAIQEAEALPPQSRYREGSLSSSLTFCDSDQSEERRIKRAIPGFWGFAKQGQPVRSNSPFFDAGNGDLERRVEESSQVANKKRKTGYLTSRPESAILAMPHPLFSIVAEPEGAQNRTPSQPQHGSRPPAILDIGSSATMDGGSTIAVAHRHKKGPSLSPSLTLQSKTSSKDLTTAPVDEGRAGLEEDSITHINRPLPHKDTVPDSEERDLRSRTVQNEVVGGETNHQFERLPPTVVALSSLLAQFNARTGEMQSGEQNGEAQVGEEHVEVQDEQSAFAKGNGRVRRQPARARRAPGRPPGDVDWRDADKI